MHLGTTTDALGEVAEIWKGEAVLVNLEGPVAAGEPFVIEGETVRLRNAPSVPPGLRASGITAVSITNNHALDEGLDGRRATRKALSAAGLAPIGNESTATLEVDGRRVVLSAFDLSDGVPKTLGQTIRRQSRGNATHIVTFHVVAPALYLPSRQLREATEIALDAGADVVAAHGSHALGPVERRGNQIIAWGLGNLAFNCECTTERDGLLLFLRFTGEDIEAAVVPVDAGLNGEPTRLASDPDATYDLLEALDSSPLRRDGPRAWF